MRKTHLSIDRRLRRAATVALCGAVFVLVGCATAPTAKTQVTAYGNHVAVSAASSQKLAGDAIKQLVVLYPPASTRFDIVQPTPDPFGAALVAGLREVGYAVMEATPVAAKQFPNASHKASSSTEPAANSLDLRYVVDQPGSSTIYRLTLAIGAQSLSRAYLVQNQSLHAAGAWVRKE